MDKYSAVNTIIIQKQTNLIVSLDHTDANYIISTIQRLAPHILGIKLHSDIIYNATASFYILLNYLKTLYNFIIIEDRKFCDIGAIVKQQSEHITRYADFITVHSISGQGILEGLRENCLKNGCRILLIAQMSTNNNLIDNTYTEKTIALATDEVNREIISGFISQKKLVNGLLHFAPGINTVTASDNYLQKYNDPISMSTINKVDALIVGRGITEKLSTIEDIDIFDLVNSYNKPCYENLNEYCHNMLKNKLRENRLIVYGPEFTLKSGQKSNIYYDLKTIISYPVLLKEVALCISNYMQQICQFKFGNSNFTTNSIVVAGVPFGGLSIANFISAIYNVPSILVRDRQKNYGMCQQIEGNFLNKNIIIIEDVITTGNSVIEFIKFIKSGEIITKTVNSVDVDSTVDVIGIISVVNRGNIRSVSTMYGILPVYSVIYA